MINTSKNGDKITVSHRNSIRSSLLVTERHLRSIQYKLEHESDANTIMYRSIGILELGSKLRILKLINAMLEEISEIREEFNLEVSDEDLVGEVAASLSEIWVVLEEITPDHLVAYGPVSKKEKYLIGPKVAGLLMKLDTLEEELQSR